MLFAKAATLLAVAGVTCQANSVTDAERYSINNVKSINFGTTLGSACACGVLATFFRNNIHFPGAPAYKNETTYYWDLKEALSPRCIFVPSTTHDVAKGIVILNACKSQFAVRGGGHMPIKGAANTDGGVLLALTNFRSNVISEDKETVTSGAGQGWSEVYQALEPYGLYAIGGRLKSIGVGGLTLGGGINYFGNKYGFTADTTSAYEVVLSTGMVVTATAKNHPELFWGLKGGLNNLGVVTKFTYNVYSVPKISGAIMLIGEDQIPRYTEAITNLAKYQPADVAGGGFFTMVCTPAADTMQVIIVGIEEGEISPPPLFANFTSIPTAFKQFPVSTPAQWHSTWDTPYQVQRRLFGVRSMRPDAAQMTKMFNLFKEANQEVKDVAGLSSVLVYQPITTHMASVGKNNGVGNVLGIDNNEPHIWWQINAFWDNATDDARVEKWAVDIREKLHALNAQVGLATEHIYANDAGKDQKPYEAISKANLARLKAVRAKYDPTLLFTKQVTGGFKLE